MSGICCILDFKESIDISVEDEIKIKNSLTFRGKDSINLKTIKNILMSQSMFVVTEEDKNEDLPKFYNNENLFIVSDTRLDNREDLIEKLSIQNLNITDSEIIIEG